MNRQFLRRNEGVALVEFAVALPFLLILFLGMLELANYTLQHQKIDKVASSMADFVTQGTSVSQSDLRNFGIAVPQIMRPFSFDGTVVFSSVANNSRNPTPTNNCRRNTTCINWQYRILGSDASQIGAPGNTPALPGNYTVPKDQNIIIAEAFLHYKPLLSISSNVVPAFTAQTIYKIAIFKPRQGTLTVLLP